MSETDLMRDLQKLASQWGARLFRQNTGTGWIGKAERGYAGKIVKLGPNDVVIRNARPFHAGFEGLSDLGGWVSETVTPDMVGSTLAVYAQAEIKLNTRATEAQRNWIDAVKAAGGRAGVAKNEADLQKILFPWGRPTGKI